MSRGAKLDGRRGYKRSPVTDKKPGPYTVLKARLAEAERTIERQRLRIVDLEKQVSDYWWLTNPDRMGR